MAPNHLSFAAQALRYFARDHDEVRRQPLDVPAAWRGGDLGRREDWIVRLSDASIDELDRARTAVCARGLGLRDVRREDVPLPSLAGAIDTWREELASGRGFVLVRGLPVERWGDDDAALVFWSLGQHLGEPGAQNPAGDLLGHVVDTGEEASKPFVRRYRTAGDIAWHCDHADVVGLLCLRAAPRGGASRIVSSVSVYNELLHRRPDLIDRLYEPFCLDTRDEDAGRDRPPYVPVPPCRYFGGSLRTFYHSDYFRSAVRHSEVPPFTEDERTLLDLYEEIAGSPDLYLDMHFEPGDIQLLSNHVILHARTAYRGRPGSGPQASPAAALALARVTTRRGTPPRRGSTLPRYPLTWLSHSGHDSHVKRARVAELKNNLSRYLRHVRAGESVIVMDRDEPIAQLVPIRRAGTGAGTDAERLRRLETRGLVRRGMGGLPPWLGKRRPPRFRGSVLRDFLEEREAGW